MKTSEHTIHHYSKETVETSEWNECINRLYETHPKGGSEGILPPHFLRATFPKIGGEIVHTQRGNSEYWSLILPGLDNSGISWTLRDFWSNCNQEEKIDVIKGVNERLSEIGITDIYHYDYESQHAEDFQGHDVQTLHNGIVLREPNAEQARSAQLLQQKVWRVDDPSFLYPYDLYHPDAGLATRLVAVDDTEVIGFLFGFYGNGKQWYGSKRGFQRGQWIES